MLTNRASLAILALFGLSSLRLPVTTEAIFAPRAPKALVASAKIYPTRASRGWAAVTSLPTASNTACLRAPGTGWDMAPSITAASLFALMSPAMAQGKDHIIRKSPSLSTSRGSLWGFALLRLLDPLLNGWILWKGRGAGWMTLKDQIFTGLLSVGALRHGFWILCVNHHAWTWGLSITVALANFWFDFTHTKCLLQRLPIQPKSLDPVTIAGVTCFVIGSILETTSELQRREFRRNNPYGKKRICTTGLWRYARHINYFGYVLWRTGLGLVSGPPYTLAYGAYHALDFYVRAIPMLNQHMADAHGQEWEQYKAQTPKVLIPGII